MQLIKCPVLSFVKKAAATRAKYHLPDFTGKSEWTIIPDVVASHPSNRNGMRMNGQRCEDLFLQVFRKFDYVEACHGAVCIDKRDDPAHCVCFHSSQAGNPHIACLFFLLRRCVSQVSEAVTSTKCFGT